MLNFNVTKDPTAIEKLFCEPFSQLINYPLSKEQGEILFSLFLCDIKETQEIEYPFLIKLIKKRLETFTFKLNQLNAILFIAIVSETPGKAVMYLTYLQWWSKKNGINNITLDILCEKIFPLGIPSNEDLNQLWNETKVSCPTGHLYSDNLIDYSTAMKSIL
jgi:hypothetical protein